MTTISHQITAYLKHIRYSEVILLLGSPFLGVFIALNSGTDFTGWRFLLFCPAAFLLVAHVYTFNDWADYNKETGRRKGTLTISRSGLLVFSLGMAILSILLFLKLSLISCAISIGIIFLSILYSHPSLKLKGLPIVPTLIHLLGGIILFLLGWSLFSSDYIRGSIIGMYFALVFAGGHLNHETIHLSEDQAAGLNTSAVRFGKKKTFLAGFTIFSLSFLYLAILAASHLLPFSLIYAIAVLYPIYIYLFLVPWREGLTSEPLISFRSKYRLIYIILGIYLWLTLIWRMR
jgi:4-hydroxybenzoate polyprenyltransferase